MADQFSSSSSGTLPRRRISLRERLSGSLRGSFPSFRRRSSGDEPRLVQWIHEDHILQQDSVRYSVKYLGFRETQQAKGSDAIIQVIGDLKARGRTPRPVTSMSWLSLIISQESLRLVDESTPDEPILIFDFATHRVSSVSEYKQDDVYLGMIIRHGTLGQHKVHVFETDHESQQVAITLAQAFHLAFSRYMQTQAEDEGMAVDAAAAAAVHNETSSPARDIDRTNTLAPNLNEQYISRTANSERPRLSMKWLTEARDCSLSQNDQQIPLVRSAEAVAAEEPAALDQDTVFSVDQQSPEANNIVAGNGAQDTPMIEEEGIDNDNLALEQEEAGGGDQLVNAEETSALINKNSTSPQDLVPYLGPGSENSAAEVPVSAVNTQEDEESCHISDDNAGESEGEHLADVDDDKVQALQQPTGVHEVASSPPHGLEMESEGGDKIQDGGIAMTGVHVAEGNATPGSSKPGSSKPGSSKPGSPILSPDDQPLPPLTCETGGDDADDFTGHAISRSLVLPGGDDDPLEGVEDWHANSEVRTESQEEESSVVNADADKSATTCTDDQSNLILSGDEGIDLDGETTASSSLGDCDDVGDQQDEANILTPTEHKDTPVPIVSIDPRTGKPSDQEDQIS